MRRFLSIIVIALPFVYMSAQQLPNSDFESWNRTYNGDAQPDYWNGSNVSQIGLKFTFVYKKPGRSGYCMYVADREVGAVGITEMPQRAQCQGRDGWHGRRYCVEISSGYHVCLDQKNRRFYKEGRFSSALLCMVRHR